MSFDAARLCGLLSLLALSAMSALAQAPSALTPYPRASEYQRHINPLEQGSLPISPPVRSGGETKSQYRLPYEGAVSVIQYDHKNDDSPLLIARHYAGELKARGFELLTICEMPCAAPDGTADSSMSWRKELDMTGKKLDLYRFGNRGLYFMAYKPDAVAAVRVGQFGDRPVSTVKLVQSASLDLGPLQAWIALQQAAPKSAALPPPPQAAAAAEPPAGPPRIVDVAPDALLAWLEGHEQQRVLVQFTSFDANCGHCAKANPVFAALSSRAASEGTVFVRSSWQPWTTVGQSPLAKRLGINGLPSYLLFDKGKLSKRVNGNWDEATLKRELLD
ncbi:thioredoxin family protein [Roseateles aquae]|uniref:thioredoxin family protein n=1 Tax=Roseateles aquae TaxID=3077235 RepID=UPI0028E8B677|nr:thioredoxin family protein [Paucibacter sp. APW11]